MFHSSAIYYSASVLGMLILRQPCLKQLNREQDWSYLRSGVGAVMENMLHHIDDQNLVCFVFAHKLAVLLAPKQFLPS
jgi:hypothetical protein